jgi:hypothetical protein
MERFITKEDLPNSLWCPKRKVIKLPVLLVEQWKSLLSRNSLMDLATTEAEYGFIGGPSKEETDKHLAWRYNGSCGRVVLSLLDPNNELSKISDAYAEIFAGNKVFLADVPSGSGAAVISILTTLAELRKCSVLPRIPLEISIVAGEISESAREYLILQLSELDNSLKEQSIEITYEVLPWDVLDNISTADLIRKITLKSQDCDSRLLVLSNFSGFLESKSNWTKAQKQFSNLFIHSRDELSAAIWIESQTNKATKFFPRLISWFNKLLEPILSVISEREQKEEEYGQAYIECEQPIKSGVFPVRLTVVRFDLPMEKKE